MYYLGDRILPRGLYHLGGLCHLGDVMLSRGCYVI